MNIYAYARVSSHDQNLARQHQAFLDFGVERKNIYSDRKSGKDFDRSSYRQLIKKLRHGDLLIVTSIDRLGRNYNEIIKEWERITKNIQADIRVLDMPLLDTRTKENGLIGQFISDLVLQILSFVAENERQNIHTRQAEGIALAKARGVRFGRPKRIFTEQETDAIESYPNKCITLKEVLRALNVKQSTFYYHLKKYIFTRKISP